MLRKVTCVSEDGLELITISVSDREQFEIIDQLMENMETVIDTIYATIGMKNRKEYMSSQYYMDTMNAIANYLLPIGYSYTLSVGRDNNWLLEVL